MQVQEPPQLQVPAGNNNTTGQSISAKDKLCKQVVRQSELTLGALAGIHFFSIRLVFSESRLMLLRAVKSLL